MYYPVFRGKRFELLGIREVLTKLQANGNICPIIEPVKSNASDLAKCLNDLQGKIKHVVLVNPTVGQLKGHSGTVERFLAPYLVPGNELIPGFIIGPSTTQKQLTSFLASFSGKKVLLLFRDPPSWSLTLPGILKQLPVAPILVFVEDKAPANHLAIFAGFDVALLRDGFHRQAKNELYPPISLFGDLHLTYAAMGYRGFGDYSIVGKSFREDRGGPAYTVAIHLTEERPIQGPILVNHFKSTSPSGVGNTAGKFLEALNLLVAHVQANLTSFMYSQACLEFIALQATQHSAGLSIAKKISIKHHLELMDTLV